MPLFSFLLLLCFSFKRLESHGIRCAEFLCSLRLSFWSSFHQTFVVHPTMCGVVRQAREETPPFPIQQQKAAATWETSRGLRTEVRHGSGPRSFPVRARLPPAAPSCAGRAGPPTLPRAGAPLPGVQAPPSAWRTGEAVGRRSLRRAGRRTRPGNSQRAAACQVWRMPILRPARFRAGRGRTGRQSEVCREAWPRWCFGV